MQTVPWEAARAPGGRGLGLDVILVKGVVVVGLAFAFVRLVSTLDMDPDGSKECEAVGAVADGAGEV